MKCLSCRKEYRSCDAGTCRECYEEASETEEDLKREIEDLKSKVSFLRLLDPYHHPSPPSPFFTDIVMVAYSDEPATNPFPVVPAHRAVLASRSPVFRAMLENQMEESLSGTIKISDVSYDALRTFVNYMYTAEACLDEEQTGCELLVLAEKYQVNHLKSDCEKFLISKLTWQNSRMSFAFARQHNAKNLLDAALSIMREGQVLRTAKQVVDTGAHNRKDSSSKM